MAAGDYVITGGMPDTVDQTSLTLRAYYKSATVDQVIFLSKAKAGSAGNPGPSGLTILPSKPAMQVLCYADGTPVNSTFTNIDGYLTVMSSGLDVTTACTLSATAVGCTGTVNTALNVPVAAHAMGYYRVTAMSADVASLTLYAVYAGNTYSTSVAIVKAKGGYEIVGALPGTNLFEGRIVFLTTNGKLYKVYLGAWVPVVSGINASSDIIAASITGDRLAAGSIITATAQINDGVIISAKIGNLQVTSAQIADLTVGTNKITGNAVTRTASAALASTTAQSTRATLLSCAYTPDTTAPVRIDWTVYYSAIGGGFAVGATQTKIEIVRNQSGVDTTLWTGSDFIDATLGDSRILSGSWVDNVANTTVRTYKIVPTTSVGGGNSTYYVGTVLFVMEIKK